MRTATQILFKCLKSPIYHSVDDFASYLIDVNRYQAGILYFPKIKYTNLFTYLVSDVLVNICQTVVRGGKKKSFDLYHLTFPLV